MPKPIIAIVGRPNVGKSTLFNRIVGRRVAIVEDMPGVTRDRNYADTDYEDKHFTLVDTGGFEPAATDRLLAQMREQATLAIEEADIIIFVLDGKEGLTPADEDVAERLRVSGKKTFFVVNKTDSEKHEQRMYEFYRLGMDEVFPVSAEHGLGVDDLLDRVTESFPESHEEPENPDIPRIAIVGRPNVGKSSLVNALLGEDRMIASNLPGTTRDAVDSLVTYNRKKYILVDTAGIRSRGKVSQGVEKYSVMRAMRAIERCDAAILIIDAAEGATEQDSKVAGLIHDSGRGMIIAVNKWDLIEEKETMTAKTYEEKVRYQLKFADYARVIFVSALSKQRIAKLLPITAEIVEERRRKISTSDLNEVLQKAVIAHRPPSMSGRPVKINYMTQVGTEPPAFSLFCNHPDGIHFSYKRYLENQLREAFGFAGTPIKMFFRRK